ncbi:B3 domain-containing protein LOC_Os12g40090-like [Carex rostrata]
MNIFYVEMHASLMHTMIIPKNFAKMLKGSNSENVELEGPSGIIWHVKMIRSNSTFSLQSGWRDFVTANGIDEKDILVFTYNGNSSFKVLIFDPSGCQKAAPFFAKKTETEGESEDCSILEIIAPHRNVKKEIISLSSSSSDTDESPRNISSCAARMRMTGERICGKRKRKDFIQESSESENDEGQHITVRKTKTKETRNKEASGLYIIPQHTHLTKAQKVIANSMARETQKGSYLFVKILTQTDTCTNRFCRLILPSDFACKVFERKKKKITLLPADLDKRSNTCTADYSCMNKIMRRYIGKGWGQFARKNGLKKGDLCLFELRKPDKRGSLTMVVHFNSGE